MDGYKLPPKKPIKRRGGGRASGKRSGDRSEPLDSTDTDSKARVKREQYDKMMAEIVSDDSDDD